MGKVDYDTVHIDDSLYCKCCGWPVVKACCNGSFLENITDDDSWDWWWYCSNKSCDYHIGEGVFHNQLGWVARHG